MWETRIYYGDTDAGGVVYYANYLQYFEKSWFEYLATRGLSLADWEKEGIYFIVKRVEIDYYSSARYGEVIQIQTEVSELTKASFTFHHRVIVKDTVRLIAEGKNQMVCITAEGKPRRLPDEFIQGLR
ncbi:MAG: YbgC/FadM family acyl-CoA thioesterase [Deltaproteobacteria bacterium]|nr:YbgC/FadM family acyl-CoA thioesterase [Deltaproteobacteria bacterium]